MVLTFTPLVFFPELIFNKNLLTLTLLGQYIIKNLIILGALGVLWIEVSQEASAFKEIKEELTGSEEVSLKRIFRFR